MTNNGKGKSNRNLNMYDMFNYFFLIPFVFLISHASRLKNFMEDYVFIVPAFVFTMLMMVVTAYLVHRYLENNQVLIYQFSVFLFVVLPLLIVYGTHV
jgi:hypothetical protein